MLSAVMTDEDLELTAMENRPLEELWTAKGAPRLSISSSIDKSHTEGHLSLCTSGKTGSTDKKDTPVPLPIFGLNGHSGI